MTMEPEPEPEPEPELKRLVSDVSTGIEKAASAVGESASTLISGAVDATVGMLGREEADTQLPGGVPIRPKLAPSMSASLEASVDPGRLGSFKLRTRSDAQPELRSGLHKGRNTPLSGTHPVYKVKNLVMEGGGARGLAYNGAIKALETLGEDEIARQARQRGEYPGPGQPGALAYVSRFAGASAGSLVALQLALGYSPDDISKLAAETDMNKQLNDGPCGWCCKPCCCFGICCGVAQMLSCNGVHLNIFCCRKKPLGINPGKRLSKWIGNCIAEKTGCPDTTFKELYELTGKWNSVTKRYEGGVEFCAVVTNLTCMTTEEWHVKTTPNKMLREAVRTSMGIPGYFEAGSELGVRGDRLHYGDGGTLCNFPVSNEPHKRYLLPPPSSLNFKAAASLWRRARLAWTELAG
eukprot:COSAG06_NODE_1227_length_10181_cov_4.722277_1_plen_409_part_00